MDNDVKVKVITSAPIAKRLLEQGYTICSIKANKYNRDKTVFVFDDDGSIADALKQIYGD